MANHNSCHCIEVTGGQCNVQLPGRCHVACCCVQPDHSYEKVHGFANVYCSDRYLLPTQIIVNKTIASWYYTGMYVT